MPVDYKYKAIKSAKAYLNAQRQTTISAIQCGEFLNIVKNSLQKRSLH